MHLHRALYLNVLLCNSRSLYEIQFEIGNFCVSSIQCLCCKFFIHFLTIPGILFYSLPVGQTVKNGKLTFSDTSYNGVITNGVYKDGTGILTDGKFGPDDANRINAKDGWDDLVV